MMTPQRRQPDTRAGVSSAAPAARLFSRALFAAALAVVALALVPGAGFAHVDIDVGDGQYVMAIGFRDEPAFLGQPNALYVKVEEYATGGTEPVEGLAATLQAKVSKDGQTKDLPLVPLGDGEYEAVFVPTALGDYTFHIAGMVGEAQVDETVTSGPNTFNSVEPLSAIEFPVPQPDVMQMQASAAAAHADAATARLLGIAGIVAGVLGIIVAAVALSRSGRPHAARTVTQPAPTTTEPTGKLIR
jgi:hypothetical protein